MDNSRSGILHTPIPNAPIPLPVIPNTPPMPDPAAPMLPSKAAWEILLEKLVPFCSVSARNAFPVELPIVFPYK